MKKFFSMAVVAALLACQYSCDSSEGSSGSGDSATVAAVPQGMKVFDLSGDPVAGLPLVINIPDENTGMPELLEGSMGGTQVRVGNDFNIEILPGGGDMNTKKAEINSNPILKNTWIIDEPEVLMYSSEIEGTDIRQYHFHVIREIGGNKYEIFDVNDGTEYTQEGIKTMVEAAKSLRKREGAAS